MTVSLPTGWSDFEGGGSDPDLCGEPQGPPECPDPPCPGEIPPPEIINRGHNSLEVDLTFNCETPIYTIDIEIVKGVPPFAYTVVTTNGSVEALSDRTARVIINTYTENTVLCNIDGVPTVVNNDQAYEQRGFLEGQSEHGGPSPCDVLENGALIYNCNGQVIGSGDAQEGDPIVGRIQADESSCTHDYVEAPNINQCNVSSTSITGVTTIYKHLFANPDQGMIVDLRTPEIIALGCNPCRLIKDTDVVVLVTDAMGANVTIEIHIDA